MPLPQTRAKTNYIDPQGQAHALAYMSRADAIAAVQELQLRLLDSAGSGEELTWGEFELVPEVRQLRYRGRAITVSPYVFDMLAALFRGRGSLVAYPKVYTAIWGPDYAPTVEVILRVMTSALRRRLRSADFPLWIKSLHCSGLYLSETP